MGFERRQKGGDGLSIGQQWSDFITKILELEGFNLSVTYGVSRNYVTSTGDMDYCRALVSDKAPPEGMISLTIPQQRYAVFEHDWSQARFEASLDSIFNQWLPQSGETMKQDAALIERYDACFDAQNMTGISQIWLTLEG